MSVTAAKGFRAAGVSAGIKATRDFALVVNDGPGVAAAAVFTSNRFPAAPVQWSRHAVGDGALRAVALNSGGANACTGADGYADSVQTAEWVGAALGVPPGDVAVCSTGLIGVRLPMDAVRNGVALAAGALSAEGGTDAAEAIMTTDTVAKQAVAGPGEWVVGGMAKGAGMLAPALATMLVVVTTDAEVSAAVLDRALRKAASLTFDRTDSDGCMSTNDTVVVLANGASGIVPSEEDLTNALTECCGSLARQLIADAEGAAHDIQVVVTGALSEADALEVARSVARSNLFKCAIFGADPNWGRVLSAIGTTAAAFEPERVDVTFNGVTVFRQGGIGEDRGLVDLTGRDVVLEIDLHAGPAAATVLTNDLTYGYVKENAEYSS
ncbi:bifunctional glutamate N-acetyltransferase/amino-acid acetyltransferase ArgJ [Propionicicella superfundia]|uniref:bifunctional glutamate N-acetyltransferase/amino-acid acetyltransferase ArgJ n=1 Tax=Propionicicella superfundia TaxID=348582 RepID=UPI0004201BF1|nr:bifunctional glutamate N-acetyltransferase/amino-acid acetyltransferase ArgJ [Propionicicella superfundia]